MTLGCVTLPGIILFSTIIGVLWGFFLTPGEELCFFTLEFAM